jgi:hypothetical protein
MSANFDLLNRNRTLIFEQKATKETKIRGGGRNTSAGTIQSKPQMNADGRRWKAVGQESRLSLTVQPEPTLYELLMRCSK